MKSIMLNMKQKALPLAMSGVKNKLFVLLETTGEKERYGAKLEAIMTLAVTVTLTAFLCTTLNTVTKRTLMVATGTGSTRLPSTQSTGNPRFLST